MRKKNTVLGNTNKTLMVSENFIISQIAQTWGKLGKQGIGNWQITESKEFHNFGTKKTKTKLL